MAVNKYYYIIISSHLSKLADMGKVGFPH